MRYYQKPPKKAPLQMAIPLWVIVALILAMFRVQRGQHLLNALAGGSLFVVALLMFQKVPFLKPYWEIRKDRVVRRGLLCPYLWRTLRFSEIEYIGPISSGVAHRFEYFDDFIEIRSWAGKKMMVVPEDPQAFLKEIRQYLPEVTHPL